MSMQSFNSTSPIGVGFGTAGLGGNNYKVVQMALEAGFRKFDTAEADWWYDQAMVGKSLQDYIATNGLSCSELEISTKIPPWSLTSISDIREHAAHSRYELLGDYCGEILMEGWEPGHEPSMVSFPLDVYYIHAPTCWNGWHPRCENPPPTLKLRDAWRGMEAVVGLDFSAKRIGLSNVHPNELLDIIAFVQERKNSGERDPPPRMPDVLQAYADPLRPADELRRICKENGIEFVSYSTLGTQHRKTPNPVLTSPVVTELASKYSRSAAEVVLSWALQKGMSIIPRSSKAQHIAELARLLKDPNFLSEGDVQAVDAMSHEELTEF